MKRQSYFLTADESSANRCVTDFPLAVNCAGIEYLSAPFCVSGRRHDYYLIFLVNGEMTFAVSGRSHRLCAGGCILLPPETQFVLETGENVNYYWLHFSGSDARALLEKLKFPVCRPFPLNINDDIKSLFSRIFQEFVLRDSRAPYALGALLTELLTLSVRAAEGGADFPLASLAYIHRHYSEPITLARLAALENFSVSHYRTVFKKYVGMPPNEYLAAQRINAACFYLKQTKMSVHEIADAVGYKDPFYFSRIFKKKLGCSPSEYAK